MDESLLESKQVALLVMTKVVWMMRKTLKLVPLIVVTKKRKKNSIVTVRVQMKLSILILILKLSQSRSRIQKKPITLLVWQGYL